HRRARQRLGAARRRRRYVLLGSGRRQRCRRGPGRHRYALIQRLQRRREDQHLGQSWAREPGARCRRRHHGPQRHRTHPARCPGWRRQHHRQRSLRYRRDAARHRPGVDAPNRRRRGGSVTVNATKSDGVIAVQGQGGSLTVAGLPEAVTISGSEATDALVVAGGAGNDTLSAALLPAGNTTLTLDGGAGNDTVTGGCGNDTALLGSGNDTFIWNPGDASDTVEGQAGTDTLVFNGANIAETIDISAN